MMPSFIKSQPVVLAWGECQTKVFVGVSGLAGKVATMQQSQKKHHWRLSLGLECGVELILVLPSLSPAVFLALHKSRFVLVAFSFFSSGVSKPDEMVLAWD